MVRALTADEIEWKRQGTGVYQRLARGARDKLRPAVALSEMEPDRRRAEAPSYDPLVLSRAGFQRKG